MPLNKETKPNHNFQNGSYRLGMYDNRLAILTFTQLFMWHFLGIRVFSIHDQAILNHLYLDMKKSDGSFACLSTFITFFLLAWALILSCFFLAEWRSNGFMPFPRASEWNETQTASSISYNENLCHNCFLCFVMSIRKNSFVAENLLYPIVWFWSLNTL